ncbi:unnamed protein product [Amoebophrya sp. A25]|nr:unnamed protein product [Amoebophrya sp. A25]|eukprot:GSA25T00027494001.1
MDAAVDLRPPAYDGNAIATALTSWFSRQHATTSTSFAFEKTLPSERDRNYLLKRILQHQEAQSQSCVEKQDRVVLKVSNRGDEWRLLRAQTEAMLFCMKRGCPTQRLVTFETEGDVEDQKPEDFFLSLNSKQQACAEDAGLDSDLKFDQHLNHDSTSRLYARLLVFEEGEVLGGIEDDVKKKCNPDIWHSAGKSVGIVSKTLREFYEEKKMRPLQEVEDSVSIYSRFWETLNSDFEWNLTTLESTLPKYLPHVEKEGGRLALVKRLFEDHLGEFGTSNKEDRPPGTNLNARTLVHNDPNDNNLVLKPGGTRTNQVIVLDFGDLAVSYPFADAAIGAAYAPSPACADAFIDGWVEEVKSEGGQDDIHKDIIHHFAQMRMVTSVCMSSFQAKQHPEDAYLQCSADGMWQSLGWTKINREDV